MTLVRDARASTSRVPATDRATCQPGAFVPRPFLGLASRYGLKRSGQRFKETPDSAKNSGVHGGSDAAGLRVLLARVIDGEQARRSGGKVRFRPVSELVRRSRNDDAALLEDFEIGVPSDFAKRKNRLGFQDFEFALEISAAIRDFSRERLVARRSAAAGGGDVGLIDLEAVLAVERDRLIREAGFVQRGVQEVAGAVAGEHASGTIGSMGG